MEELAYTRDVKESFLKGYADILAETLERAERLGIYVFFAKSMTTGLIDNRITGEKLTAYFHRTQVFFPYGDTADYERDNDGNPTDKTILEGTKGQYNEWPFDVTCPVSDEMASGSPELLETHVAKQVAQTIDVFLTNILDEVEKNRPLGKPALIK